MKLWNLGGLNPKFKDFENKHPKKSMIGMAWSLHWRLMLFVFALELIGVGLFLAVATIAGKSF